MSIYHKDKTLISSLSLEVERYSFHCIVGESGSGKSLLVRSILHMTDDQLTYQGNVDIDLLHADAMFQDANSNLFQNITIKQHIAMLYDAKKSTLSRAEQYQEVKTMMTRLGLEQPEQLLQYYPFELSGGMAQRVAFILSLIRNPQCLILDEPTSALDVQNRIKFMQQLMHIISERKMTVIFVTHDLSLVKDYATHVSIMQHGQIIESGQAQQVMHHPERHYTQTLIRTAERREAYATG